MKGLKYILLTALFSFALVGCEDAFDLEGVNPTDQVPSDLAITNLASAQAAIAGVYDEMQSAATLAFDGYLSQWQYFSDETVFTGTFPTRLEFANFNVFPSNTTMAGVFTEFYDIINVVNNVAEILPTVDDVSLTPEIVNSFLGEARFARALAYLHLVLGWGEVPLVLTPTREVGEVLNVSKSSEAAIYDQIIQDLQFAAQNIDDTQSLGITADAANALLARIALYQERWQDAYDLAVGVLGDDFDLTDFAYLEDEIFYIEFINTDGNSNAFFYAPAELNGRHSIEPSEKLINAYEEGDIRRDLSVDTETVPGTPFGVKYNDFAAASGTQNDPLYILRYAELVLIAAEAAAELGNFTDANRWFNTVRARAGLPALTLDAGNFVELILQERFVELAMEGGHRLWDLRRRGLALEVLGPLGYEACDDVWPLPQRDIDRNPNLQQNDCCNC